MLPYRSVAFFPAVTPSDSAAPQPPPAQGQPSHWHWAVIALLVLLQVLAGLFAAVSSSDTNRDLFMAQQIASGQWFPVLGPAINGMVHLGPLWFYLLAPALWVWPNAAAVTATMGAISGLQFPLAYALGRRLGSPSEGLLFALALALPSWGVTAFGSLTHPIMVVPSLLFGAWMALRYRERPGVVGALGVGLTLALMCAAHPTLALLGAALVACSLAMAPRDWRAVLHLMAMGLPLLASLAPMLLQQWLGGTEAPDRLSTYARSDWSLPSPMAGLELIHAVIVHAPHYLARYWLGLSREAAAVLFAAYLALLALAAAGLALRLRTESGLWRRVLALVALLLLHSMFVAAIRAWMPPWMVYAHWLFIAALIAMGLQAWWSRALLRSAVLLLFTAGVGQTVACYAWLNRTEVFPDVDASGGRHPYLDVRGYTDLEGRSFRLPRTRFLDLFDLAAFTCEPVTVYGHLAQQLEYTSAVSLLHACGDAHALQLGGSGQVGGAAWVGLQRDAWRAANLLPQRSIGRMGLFPGSVILHSGPPLKAVRPETNALPRRVEAQARDFALSGLSQPGSVIVVAHRAFRYLPFERVSLALEGQVLSPAYADLTLSLFVIPGDADAGARSWQLHLYASPEHVDVLSLEASPAS